MLNSAEQEICPANRFKLLTNVFLFFFCCCCFLFFGGFFCFVFSLLNIAEHENLSAYIVGIFIFINKEYFMLS